MELRDCLSKGGVGEILLADRLGNWLAESDKGFDGECPYTGARYEYKVSTSDQFNFHFGSRSPDDPITDAAKIAGHSAGIRGVFIAARDYDRITKIAYMPTAKARRLLLEHFMNCSGRQLNKVYSFDDFKVAGARDVS